MPLMATIVLLSAGSDTPMTIARAGLRACNSKTLMMSTCTHGAVILEKMYTNSTDACCAACLNNTACATWTLNTKDKPTTCFLKEKTTEYQEHKKYCTTGIIDRPAPGPGPSPRPTPANARNVLFIPVDDMRPMMRRAYNFSSKLAFTPTMDKLSEEGLTFSRAYVQYAYCSPSRNSFMTGRRPDTTRVWEFVDHFREKGVGENWISLPEYFKVHGYITLGSGKLYHPASKTENVGMANNDYPASWSPEWPYFDNQPIEDPYKCRNPQEAAMQGRICEAEVSKDESKLTDQKIRDSCIDHLHLAVNESRRESSKYYGKPFFIGCGLHKPHVPYRVPAEFFDLLPQASDIPLPPLALQYAPSLSPVAAWHAAADVRGMCLEQLAPKYPSNTTAETQTQTPPGPCNNTRAQLYRRAYYASVAYQDYIIGQVLGALRKVDPSGGVENNTLVVVFGDHGWQLGEHDTWAKMTNWELGVHIPLMMKVPWLPQTMGAFTDVLAEMTDMYPTLTELAVPPSFLRSNFVGLPDPHSLGEGINGTSLAPLFSASMDRGETGSSSSYVYVDRQLSAALKTAAYSQFAKTNGPNNTDTSVFNKYHRNATKLMGYTIRTDEWRYTAWFKFDDVNIKPLVSPADELGRELYDHRGDTGMNLEWPGQSFNLESRPENAGVVQALHQKVLDYIRL